MKVESILGNLRCETSHAFYDIMDKEKIAVKFEWFELEKKRIKKKAEDGYEFGIIPNKIIEDGDIIAEIDNKIYFCQIKSCLLTQVETSSLEEMGKLCFELGNRHLPLKIKKNKVFIPYDKPTFDYLEKMAFNPVKIEEKFSDFLSSKAHAPSVLSSQNLCVNIVNN